MTTAAELLDCLTAIVVCVCVRFAGTFDGMAWATAVAVLLFTIGASLVCRVLAPPAAATSELLSSTDHRTRAELPREALHEPSS